jgi:hypothetical protein
MNYRFAACATLALCVCLVLSIPAGAQTQTSDKAQKISQALNLSSQQQSQLTPILENEEPKVQAIKNDPNLTSDQKQAKTKKVYEQTDKLVKPILNPVQWKQWEQYRTNELANIK